MKVVYCAVGDRRKNANLIFKQMQFSYAAVRYLLSPKQASEQYGDLRANLDVQFVREVWDLLEDPVTSFFATQFGLVATTGRMTTNLTVRVPVPTSEICFAVSEQQIENLKAKKLKLLANSNEVNSGANANANSLNSSLDAEKKKKKKKEKESEKKEKENEKEGVRNSSSAEDLEQDVTLEFSIRNSNGSEDGNQYRIRCRYLSQYVHEIDPSLVLKVGERSNFIETDQSQVVIKKRANRSSSVTSIIRSRVDKVQNNSKANQPQPGLAQSSNNVPSPDCNDDSPPGSFLLICSFFNLFLVFEIIFWTFHHRSHHHNTLIITNHSNDVLLFIINFYLLHPNYSHYYF